MTVHVFGNSPSPSVATYFMRKSSEDVDGPIQADVHHFIENNFDVDDGLVSCSTSKEAIELVSNTQRALKHNLRLHKIAPNDPKVMKSFDKNDLAKDLIDFQTNANLPLQHSLCLKWDLVTDVFTFRASKLDKPYTRKDILSVINSLFDPIGFIAPVVIRGKKLMWNIVKDESDWDSKLPPELNRNGIIGEMICYCWKISQFHVCTPTLLLNSQMKKKCMFSQMHPEMPFLLLHISEQYLQTEMFK